MRSCLVAISVLVGACGGKSNPESDTGTVLPEPACSRVECGEKPLFYQRCPDGTGVGASSTCERSTNGQCSYIMEPCPATPAAAGSGSGATSGSGRGSGTAEPLGCLPEQCGPQKPMMEAICPDGRSTTRPTGRCIAIGDACGWEMSSCP